VINKNRHKKAGCPLPETNPGGNILLLLFADRFLMTGSRSVCFNRNLSVLSVISLFDLPAGKACSGDLQPARKAFSFVLRSQK
jgi:hypothetical protein